MKTKYLFFLISTLLYPLLIYVIVPYIHSLQDFRTGTDAAGGGMASGFAFIYGCFYSCIFAFILSIIVGQVWFRAWWIAFPAIASGLFISWAIYEIHQRYESWEESRPIDYQEYYDSGELQETGRKSRDEKHGKVTEFYKDGTVKSVQTYEEGVCKGPFQLFYPNGKLKAEGVTDNINSYDENNRMDGKWQFYQENGSLDDERIYKKGELLSSKSYTLFYDTAGLIRTIKDRLPYTGVMKKTAIVSIALFPNVNDGQVVDGYREGPYTEFFTNGGKLTPAITATFKNRELDGDFKQYHENGQLAKSCFRIDGKLEGEYMTYYADSVPTRPIGPIEFSGFYKNGEANRTFRWYHENGQLAQEREYVENKCQGLSHSYREDGSLHKITEWKDGERIQETYYDEQGQPIQ